MVPTRTWVVHAAGMAPTERLKLRRQMAAAAGKKSTTSSSLLAYGVEVEEELPTLEAFGLEVEEDISLWPPRIGQKWYGLENGS